MTQNQKPAGMRAFIVIWLGQVVSMLGTGMTQFALTIWAWQETGEATTLALVGFFNFGPTVLLSPIAGALVDRWNRKLVMMLSDLGAGIATVALLTLFALGKLEIWHLYVAGAFTGAFNAFQFPAYSAAISTMLPKSQYARASGMLELALSGGNIIAPLLAGLLLAPIGINGIMTFDVITFTLAIGALLIIHLPIPKISAAGKESQGSLWSESLYGFKYIAQRKPLLGLQLIFLGVNLIGTLGFVLLSPMVLARTGENELILGSVLSAGAIGGVVGGALLSVWGGPRRKIHGVLIGMTMAGLLGELIIGLGHGLFVWALGAFLVHAIIPVLNGSNQAIWQAKVPPDVQGRVFATRRLIAQASSPIAMLVAGPLADRIFEPAMQKGGSLAPIFGWLVGVEPGSGMSLMFVFAGIFGGAIGLFGYLFRPVRLVEDLLPDHESDALTSFESVASESAAPA